MLQAPFIDPMPEAIKEALNKPMNMIPLTAHLIEEAQEEGKCVKDDPMKLASNYWSFMNGIIMNKTGSIYMKSYKYFQMPDVETVLKILKD